MARIVLIGLAVASSGASDVRAAGPSSAAPQLLFRFPANVTSWTEMPNGHLLLKTAGFGTGPSSVLDPATGQILRTFAGPIAPRFSPDGSVAALTVGSSVEILDPATWRPRVCVPGVAPFFSPDGSVLVVQTGRGNFAAHHPATGERMYAFRGHAPRFSPAGRYVGCQAVDAQASPTGSPVVYDATTGTALQHTIWSDFSGQDRFMLSARGHSDGGRDVVDPRTGDRVGRIDGIPLAYNSTGTVAVLSLPDRPGSRSSNVSVVLADFPSGPEIREITRVIEEDGVPLGQNSNRNPRAHVPGVAAAVWERPFFARNDELLVFAVREYQPVPGLISNDRVQSIWIYDARSGRLLARHVGFILIAEDLASDRLVLGEVSSFNGAQNSTAGFIVRREHPAVRVLDLNTLAFVENVDPWPGLGGGSIRSYPSTYLPEVPALLTILRIGGRGVVRLADGATIALGDVQDEQIERAGDNRYLSVPRAGRTVVYDLRDWREVASLEGRVDFLRNDRFVYISPTGEVSLYAGSPSAAIARAASSAQE